MAHDIKLDCYSFTFKKERQNEEFKFSDFYENLKPEDQPDLNLDSCYRIFHADLLNYFGEGFKLNGNRTKGISLRAQDESSILARNNIISGVIRGGLTGIGKKIQAREDAQTGEDVDPSKIHSLPYYFLIWTPSDMSMGIVIIQSYSNEVVSGLFMKNLGHFFRRHQIKLLQTKKILPTSIVDDFRNHASVKSITLSKSTISREKRAGMKPILTNKEKLKIELVIKGLGSDTNWDQVRNWVREPQQSFLGVDLSGIDLEEGYDRTVEYYYQGRTSRGKLSKDFQIIPSLVITDEILIDGQNHPVFNSIDTFAKNFLEDLKTEIGYNV